MPPVVARAEGTAPAIQGESDASVQSTSVEHPVSSKNSDANVAETQVADAQPTDQVDGSAPSEPQSLLTPDPTPTISNPNVFSQQGSQPKVDGSSGALTQRISLAIPPGRNGIQPDLALEYNSQRTEDGIVGYGWSVSIPYIERMNKTGSQDMYNRPYYSSSLEGELATTSTASTTPYRAKIDNGAYNSYSLSNDIWTVYDKKGTKYTYGSDQYSRIQSTSSPTLIYRWMLQEVRDTNGNYIKYIYAKDNNQIYPYKIVYTGNGVTDGPMTITFSTSTRPDQLVSFRSGFNVTTKHRITQIQADVSGNWTARYTLAYTTGNNGYRSMLSSVQQTGQDESANQISLPPINFGYISTTTQFYRPSGSNLVVDSQARAVADTDGNGKNDITTAYYDVLSLTTAAYTSLNQQNSVTVSPTPPDYWANNNGPAYSMQGAERGVRYVDANTDGKADIAVGTSSSALYISSYATSTGYAWTATTTYHGTVPQFLDPATGYTQGFFGEVNGDGLPDFQAAILGSTKNAYLGNGSAWDAPSTTIFAAAQYIPGSGNPNPTGSQLVDVNGDGLDDWVWSGSGDTYVQLNNGRGWDTNADPRWYIATSTFYHSGSSYYDRGMRFMDMNGDGLVDFVRSYGVGAHNTGVAVDDTETGNFSYVMLNTGSGWGTTTLATFPATITTAQVQGCYPCTFYGLFSFNEFANWDGNGQNPQDVLQTIGYISGGTSTISYERSTLSGLNPELATSLLVVSKVTTDDGFGNISSTTYSYNGGKMYLASGPRERKFGGFWKTTESKSDSVVTTYFGQGDGVASTSGETVDGFAQINRPYREDVSDFSGSVFQRTFTKWDSFIHGNSLFVGLTQKLTQLFNGSASHKDKAETYSYASTTNDDLLEFDEYGEVLGKWDGTFENMGDDERATLFTYAASSSVNLSLPIKQQVVKLDFSVATITPATSSVRVLVVGGGGSGAASFNVGSGGGGGGAGGFVEMNASTTAGSYTVTVGTGGATHTNVNVSANSGASSTFGTLASVAGGGGGGTDWAVATAGASGGGGSAQGQSGASGISGQGFAGGNGASGGGGGGGGASQAGLPGTGNGGSGGNGRSSNITNITAASVSYAGGGGGSGTSGGGGRANGGDGSSGTGAGAAATAGSGSGGGGGRGNGSATFNGGAGGSGIVVASYPAGTMTASGGSVATSGAQVVHTFTSNGTFQVTSVSPYLATSSVFGAVQAETKYSYDNLAYGSINVGNPTKVEKWISGSTYASTTKTYNSYGLPTQEKDPRSNTASFTYDSLNMYVATSTNPLSHTVGYVYDYSIGKPKFKFDENSRLYQTVFDALDRVTQEKQPDQTTPTTLVVKTQNTYTDTPKAVLVQRTANLNGATSTNAYEYLDGLGRTIQTRISTETSNQYVTRDTQYDPGGNNSRESLPYFSAGSGRGTATLISALYTTTLRDPLGRVSAVGNAVGSTTNAYSNWTLTTTDPLLNQKDLVKDAFGNLVNVVEHNLSQVATTTYTWDLLGNLATTTDALGNVRGFVYDGLNRRTQAQDLHNATDTTYGLYRFTYDLAGNVTQQLDAKNQTVNYTYDGLNRPLTEDFTGQAGTEITYTYDSCTEGKTRLCIAATPSATSSYAYNALGLTKFATTTASSTDYMMRYSYDRLGNITDLTYPNNTLVSYTYNNGGQLFSVQKKIPSDSVWTAVASTTGYSPLGQVGTTTFANGLTTVRSYDANHLYRLQSLVTFASTTSVVVPAIPGNSHSLDLESGSNQYAYATDHADFDMTSDFTLEAWVKPESYPADGLVMASKVAVLGSGENNAYAFGLASSTSMYAVSSQQSLGITSTSIPTGTWTHLATVYDGATKKASMYINGSLVGTTTAFTANPANNTAPFRVGMYRGTTEAPFDGLIDEVRLWSVQRTQGELSANKSQTLNGSESNLMAYYRFDNSYSDQTAAAKTLTAVASPVFSTSTPFVGGTASTTTLVPTNKIQDISYTYDANGNITQITDSSVTGAAHATTYTYDGLNRLRGAQMTNASSSLYSQYYQYNELGNITYMGTTSPLGGNTFSLDLESGSNQYAYHADTSVLDLTGDMTVEAWVKPESYPVDGLVMASKVAALGSGENNAYAFGLGSATNMYFTSSQAGLGVTSPTIPAGTWTHVAAVYDSTTKKAEFFVNGLSIGTTTAFVANPSNNTAPFRVGMYRGSNEVPFDGLIDDVRVWNTKRTGTQLLANKGSELAGNESGLVAYYKFNNAYTDGTSNADDLTAVNSPVFSSDTPTASATTSPTHLYAGTGYANPHAPTTVFGVNQTYDNNGNLATSSPWNFYWDYRNRLTQVATGTATSTYAYDYQNQRVRQTVGSVATIYPHRYFDLSGATSTSYVFFGDSLVSTVVADGRATTTRYITPDHLGSTNVVTNASGTPVQVLDYLPYGGVRFSSSTNQTNEKHQFIGQYTDSSELNYLNARYLHNSRGQFLSEDPVFLAVGNILLLKKLVKRDQLTLLADPQQMNSYSYGAASPIQNKDETGLQSVGPGQNPLIAALEFYGYVDLGRQSVNFFSIGPSNVSDQQRAQLGFDTLLFGVGWAAAAPEAFTLTVGSAALSLKDSYCSGNPCSDFGYTQKISPQDIAKKVIYGNGGTSKTSTPSFRNLGMSSASMSTSGSVGAAGGPRSVTLADVISGLQNLINSLKSYNSVLQKSPDNKAK